MTAERWHRTADLAGLAGMPRAARPVRAHGASRGWISREVAWGRRTVLEWLESSLPDETQAALREARGEGGTVETVLPVDAGGPVGIADARVEILAAFERWLEPGAAVVPSLREWCRLYTETGAGVSAETRALIPTVAWNTVHRWRLAQKKGGSAALIRGRGGRTGGIEADERFLAKTEALLFANPHHLTAKAIVRALAAEFPDRPPPSISTVRRFVRRWRREMRTISRRWRIRTGTGPAGCRPWDPAVKASRR